MAEPTAEPRTPAVARYKSLLRDCIDRRPSGLRGRLARALGKHKSFISQITNPIYDVPIPAGDLATIFDVCHLSAQERERFLALYDEAHPKRAARRAIAPPQGREVRIRLPDLADKTLERELEALIRDFAARTIRIARHAEGRAREEQEEGSR
jgi:hypothetical protein